MTYFHACVGCAHKATDCYHLVDIKTAMTGYSVTSIKHKCSAREPLYMPGEAVEVFTYPDYESGGEYGEDRSPKCWFAAHFIEQDGAKALCLIKTDAQAIDDPEWTFTPSGQGKSGFVKVPLARVRKRTSPAEDVILQKCPSCPAYLPLEACGYDENSSWRPVGCKTRPDLSANPGWIGK